VCLICRMLCHLSVCVYVYWICHIVWVGAFVLDMPCHVVECVLEMCFMGESVCWTCRVL